MDIRPNFYRFRERKPRPSGMSHTESGRSIDRTGSCALSNWARHVPMTATPAGERPLPQITDRQTWQARIDGLRVKEKAHTRAGDALERVSKPRPSEGGPAVGVRSGRRPCPSARESEEDRHQARTHQQRPDHIGPPGLPGPRFRQHPGRRDPGDQCRHGHQQEHPPPGANHRRTPPSGHQHAAAAVQIAQPAPSSSKPQNANPYAVSDHCASIAATARSRCNVGKAMAIASPSAPIRKCAAHTTASPAALRVPPIPR
jgi:hypothetical protein